MKKYMRIAVGLFTFLLFSNLFAQNKFEGKVVFQVEDEGRTESIGYFVKGEKFRIEPEESKGQGVMIYDAKKNSMLMLMNEQKMYMEIPLESDNINSDESKVGYFKNTGETKTINGYTCERFIFKDETGKGEAWMTKELGGFLFFNDFSKGEPKKEDWQKAMMDEGYFPMEVNMLEESGKPKQVFKVIELKAMDLDDSMFSPPAGFKKFDMKGMMNK